MTKTISYDAILEKTPKAVCFSIDDTKVWLPRTRLVVNTAQKLVQSDLLEKNLYIAKTADRVSDLGPIVWRSDNGASVAHDVDVILDGGDADLSTIRVRVFVPTSLDTQDGQAVPHWLIHQAIDRQASTMIQNTTYTVRNYNGDPIIATASPIPEEDATSDTEAATEAPEAAPEAPEAA